MQLTENIFDNYKEKPKNRENYYQTDKKTEKYAVYGMRIFAHFTGAIKIIHRDNMDKPTENRYTESKRDNRRNLW